MQSVEFNLVAVGGQDCLLLLLLHHLRQAALDGLLLGVGLATTGLPAKVHLPAATAALRSLRRTLTAIVGSYDEAALALLRSDIVIGLGDKEDAAGLLREAPTPSRIFAFGKEVLFVLPVMVVVRVFRRSHL